VIDEMGRCLGHPSSVAQGADGAAFAGEGDQEVVATLLATRRGEAIGQNTALQVATQLPFGMGRDALVLPIVVTEGEEGLEMVLHRAVERCIGGTAPAVGGGRASLRVDGHVRIPAWVDIL
jgi:hypothetical protein